MSTDEGQAVQIARLEEQEQQEKTKVRVRQFMNILEQLPRLCSPTICGTLSQPTTRAELSARGADMFEWSLEQKAILSPANITTDTDDTDEWQHNVADLNPSWRQLESERFFSQRTIAPSPHTPMRSVRGPKYQPANIKDLILDEEEEGEVAAAAASDNYHHQPQDLRTNSNNNHDHHNQHHEYPHEKHHLDISDNQSSRILMSYTELDDDSDFEFKQGCDDDEREEEGQEGEEARDEDDNQQEEDQDMDNLFFSPQPLASSQSQQRMDVFSPDTFVHCMEDDNTLQSTPKTTGSISRTRRRSELLD